MNSIASIQGSRALTAKVFTLTNFTLPATLLFYYTVLEDEVDTTQSKLGNYKTLTYNTQYYGSTFIDTDSPFSGNANMGSIRTADTSNYAIPTQSFVFNSGGSYTLSFWFKLTSVTGNGTVRFPFLFGETFGTNIITPEFNYNSSGVLTNFFVYCLNCAGARIAPNTNLLNNWVHFAIVIQHATVPKIYVNNTLYNSTNGTCNFNAQVTMNNGRIPHASNYMIGNLTEIRLYNTALTATQIGNIYSWNGSAGTQPTY
jgi:hypothetical protein